MRHSPYESEYAAVQTMSDNQRLEYFMSRVFEAEEVWFLNTRAGKHLRPVENTHAYIVWPYKRFATEAALDHWQDAHPSSCSLEYFMDQTLEELIAEDITLDVMPRGEQPGCLINPARLRAILQGMIDAGEYRLDS